MVVPNRLCRREISDGEFVILVGPSGCGKSTALRMIAGLEDITSGELRIDGETVNDRAPKERDIAMVFQNYALYPHMTVRENMGFALKLAGADKSEIDQKVEEAARTLDLEQHLDRRPANLSGGQRQRVAMGRAIVRDPKAFLMDEPLSNLDAKLRVQMRTEVARLQSKLETTTVYVTHDQTEAMTLGQRVAVLRDGRILQVDTPQRLYHEPRDVFVAAFIGTPAMNLVEAVIDGDDAVFGRLRIRLDPARRPAPGYHKVTLGIRPEAFEAAASAPAGSPTIEVEPAVVEELGSDAHVFFPVDAARIGIETGQDEDDERTLLAQDKALFGARIDPRVNAVVGRSLTLAVDPARFHFFDVDTGFSLLAASDMRADEPLPHELTPVTP